MRIDRRTSLALSALLHLAVFGFGMVSWHWFGKPMPVKVTPVTLMTADEVRDLMAATASPTPEPAATEDPVIAEPLPEAPEPAPVPAPAPAPAAPAPKPAPAPEPKAKAPSPKAPEPKAPAPAAPKTERLNLDALADSLAKTSPRAGGAPKTAGQKGPSRPETDLTDRQTQGQARATSQTALNRLVDQLNRAWRPACGPDGAPNVNVRLRLNQDGSLERAELVDFGNAQRADVVPDPATRAAATRALSAAAQASPYLGLPREDYDYWRSVRVVFDGKKACELL